MTAGQILRKITAQRRPQNAGLGDIKAVHQRDHVRGPLRDATGIRIAHGDDMQAIGQRLYLVPEDVGAAKRAGNQQQCRAGSDFNYAPVAPIQIHPLLGMGSGETVARFNQRIAHAKGSSTAGQ